MNNIQVVLDTNIIQDNTREGVRVNILQDAEAVDSYTLPNGDTIKVPGLTVAKPAKVTTIGQIKSQIDSLMKEITTVQAQLDALNAQLPDVEAAVDETIATAITNGATDERTAQVANPPIKL